MLPRPPGATEPPPLRWVPSIFAGLFRSITTAEGPGFPSGHALGTTMVWGGLALVIDRGRVRTRVGIAGIVIALVSVSRLILGVHYVVDVLTGVLLGIVILGGLYVLADHGADSERVLLVAVVIGVLGLVVNLNFDSVAAVGGAVGAWVVWRRIAEATPTHPTETDEVFVALVVAVLAAVIFGATYAVRLPYPLTFLGTAMATGLTVSAPLLGERLA
ncbi:phosphatase PAP2 family protein [Halomarina pelagica]|uniref:phosphatase PAP2 family protein n=1 Tax=Halomarina pelagica TaxID=2961599 RepID=UPI0020C499B0|nr:phosphatase PAP2 family protein [Halomarina sp. BND7]